MQTNQRKHDTLSFNRSTVHIIAATVNLQAKVVTCGHFYINNCSEKEVLLSSQTGYKYLVEIPEEYLNVLDSGQFNVIIPLIKQLIQDDL